MSDWVTLAQDLAKGAAGELPAPYNVLGGALLNQLFPGDDGIDWAAIAQQFGSIVRQQLDQSFFDQSAGKIQGFVSYMAHSYNDQKTGGTPHATLFSNLEMQNQQCYDLIGILEQPAYQQGGLNTKRNS